MTLQLLPPPAPEAVIISELLALLFPALCGDFFIGILRKRIETRKSEVKNKLCILALGLYFRPVSTWL